MMKEKAKRGPGRPPKETKMADYKLYVYLPNEEAAELVKQAAESEGLSASHWARVVLLREARRALAKAG